MSISKYITDNTTIKVKDIYDIIKKKMHRAVGKIYGNVGLVRVRRVGNKSEGA